MEGRGSVNVILCFWVLRTKIHAKTLLHGKVSAYLTVSENFPLEIRAPAITFFWAVGTAVGGIVSP